MACSATTKYKSNESPVVGLIRLRGSAKYCFTFSKAYVHSSVHLKSAALRIALKMKDRLLRIWL
jgi:hypothetical protein